MSVRMCTGLMSAYVLLAGCFQAEAPRPAAIARTENLSASPREALARVAVLAEYPDEKSTPALAALIRDAPDPGVRQEAIYALADVADAAEAPMIAEALSDPDVDVRLAAVDVLSTMEGETPAGLLASALNDANPRVRLAAVHAFGDREGPTSLLSLQQAAADPDARIRETAMELLEERGNPEP